jgi:hypothetical protein
LSEILTLIFLGLLITFSNLFLAFEELEDSILFIHDFITFFSESLPTELRTSRDLPFAFPHRQQAEFSA